MAVTSIWRVHGSVGKVLDYVENAEKTTAVSTGDGDLSDVIDYAIQQRKTSQTQVRDMKLKFCCTRRQRIILTSWESKSSPLSNLSGRNTPIFWNKNGKPILPISRPKMI